MDPERTVKERHYNITMDELIQKFNIKGKISKCFVAKKIQNALFKENHERLIIFTKEEIEEQK